MYVCVCVCVRIITYIHTYIHTYIYIYICGNSIFVVFKAIHYMCFMVLLFSWHKHACLHARTHTHTHHTVNITYNLPPLYAYANTIQCVVVHACTWGPWVPSLTVSVLAGPPQLTRRLRYFNTATADHHTATLPWLHLGSCKPQQLTTVEGSKSDLFLEPLSDQHYQKELPVP